MSVKCILAEQSKGGDTLELLALRVITPPTKTSYYHGQSFDSTGLVLEADFGVKGVILDSQTIYDDDSHLSFSPEPLVDGTTAVTITYNDNKGIASTTIPITVTHVLISIAVTTQPTTTTYEYGDSFSITGMVVTATYSDNATANVTSSCTVVPANGTTLSTVGTQTIAISYGDASVTSAKTTSTSVTVSRKSVAKPTWKNSAPTYTGSSINVASSTYWNNWNTAYFNYADCSGTNAGSYTATFTPTSNYRWNDGSTGAITVGWSIAKKTPTLSVTPTSISINADNYSAGVAATITYDGDGTLSAVSSNSTVASVTGSGTKNLTIKGDGSTAGDATITISATASTNYSAPSNATISVSVVYTIYLSTVPSQSGSLTYNGSNQTPTWSNYDSSQLSISGTTSSTNAGTFTATFTPKAGYGWSDGSTSKNATWKINKANGYINGVPTGPNYYRGNYTLSASGTLSTQGSIYVTISGNVLKLDCTGCYVDYQNATITAAASTNYNSYSTKIQGTISAGGPYF